MSIAILQRILHIPFVQVFYEMKYNEMTIRIASQRKNSANNKENYVCKKIGSQYNLRTDKLAFTRVAVVGGEAYAKVMPR